MSDHEYQDDTFSEYASDDTYEIVSRGSAYSHSDEEDEHEEMDVSAGVPKRTLTRARSEEEDGHDIVPDEACDVVDEHDLETVHNSSVDQRDRDSGRAKAGLLGRGTLISVLGGSYVEAENRRSSEELEADADQQLSTPTIVPAVVDFEATGSEVRMVEPGILLQELPIKDQPGVIMGVLALELPTFTSQYGQNKLTVKMPLNKEKLNLSRPFRLLYCGLPEHQQRVVDKLTQALSLSATETTVETFLEINGCKAFIEIYTSQSHRDELCIMSEKDHETTGSHRIDHPTIFLHEDDVQITKYWMPDLAIVVQEEWSFTSVLFDADKIKKQNVPVIELWMNTPDDMWRNQPCDEEAVHLIVQHGSAPVDSSLEEEARKILLSPKKVGLDIATFENINDGQLNRHIAHLQRKAEVCGPLEEKIRLPHALTQCQHVASTMLTNAGKTVEASADRAVTRLKLAGQPAHAFVFKQSRTPAEVWRLFAKLAMGCLFSITLLALGCVGFSMGVSKLYNIAELDSAMMSAQAEVTTLTVVSTITVHTAAVCTPTNFNPLIVSSVAVSEQVSTKGGHESTLGKSICDIITGHKLVDSAVAEWFDFRAQKMLSFSDKQAKQAKACTKSEEGLIANWTLKGNEDNFIITTATKTTWLQKLRQPSLVAVNATGLCRTIALVSVDSSTYGLKLNAEELDGFGILIMGDALDDGYLLQGHTIMRLGLAPEDLQTSSNLTGQAIHVMKRLQRERTGTAPLLSHLYHEIQDTMSGVKSRVQQMAVEAGGSADNARKHLKSLTNTDEWTSTFDDWSRSYCQSIPDAKKMKKALHASMPTLRKRRVDFKSAAKVVQDQSRSAAEKVQHDAFVAVKKASKRARDVSGQLQGAGQRVQGGFWGAVEHAVGGRAGMVWGVA